MTSINWAHLDKNFAHLYDIIMRSTIVLILVLAVLVSLVHAQGIASTPLDITCDGYGNLFVLDISTQKILKYDKNLVFEKTALQKWSLGVEDISSATVCYCNGEIAIASQKNGATRLFEINPKWEYDFKRVVAPVGAGKGEVKKPTDIVYLRSKEDYWLAITDSVGKKVVVIDDYGKFKYEITGLSDPRSSYYSVSKQVFVIDGAKVKVYSSSGSYMRSFGEGKLSNPSAIDASANEDKFFVLDDGFVKVFGADGKYLSQFGQIQNATGLGVNTTMNWVMVVSSNDGGTLLAYSYDGRLQKTVKSAANPAQEMVLTFTVGSYVYSVNGVPQKLRCKPSITDGRTLVPLRELVEPLGGKVAWDEKQRKITIQYSKPTKIELVIGNPYVSVDGKKTLLPSSVPPAIHCGNVTMVPLRFVSDVLGAKTAYYELSKTIEVRK